MKLYTHFTANNIKLTEMPFVHEIAMEGYLIENESVLAIDEENLSEPEILGAEISLKTGAHPEAPTVESIYSLAMMWINPRSSN